MSATAVIFGIVRDVIGDLRGKPTDLTAENIAKTITDKVLENIAATIRVELEKHAAALGMVVATRDLADAATELLLAMREAGRSPASFGALPAEQMPPDWKPEPEQ